RDRLIAPLLAKRMGQASAPKVEEGESVEAAVEHLRGALPALVEEARRAPSDQAARDALRVKLAGLRDDAELIGDSGLAAQAGEAMKELEGGAVADLAETAAAIADIGAAPAPEISEETRRLL